MYHSLIIISITIKNIQVLTVFTNSCVSIGRYCRWSSIGDVKVLHVILYTNSRVDSSGGDGGCAAADDADAQAGLVEEGAVLAVPGGARRRGRRAQLLLFALLLLSGAAVAVRLALRVRVAGGQGRRGGCAVARPPRGAGPHAHRRRRRTGPGARSRPRYCSTFRWRMYTKSKVFKSTTIQEHIVKNVII